jgi:methionine-rich copper-binding protein CopC
MLYICHRRHRRGGLAIASWLTAALVVATPWVAAQSPLSCVSHDPECTGCGKAAMLAQRLARGLPTTDEALEVPQEALGDTDLLHVDLDVEIIPATTSLAGTCTLTLRSVTGNLSEFTFRLRENLVISSATIGGVPVNVATVSTTTRVATLDRAYAQGETFSITIVYAGPAISRGFGSIEFQQTPGGNPIIATLSEAFYAYTWWPAKEGDVGQPGDMSDKATFDLAITAPAALTSVSNGLLQGIDTLSGDRRRFRWSTGYPQAIYLAALGSSVYNTWTVNHTLLDGRTMPVQFYIYPESDSAENRAGWEVCLPAMDVFESLFGPYPFGNEKYGMYQFPFSGGMEHQTMTGQGVFIDEVTVHELAHQWWGDDVTCRTWSDIWLNEGFATYSEALFEEFRPGSSGTAALYLAMAQRRPGNVSGAVYRTDTSSNNTIFSGNSVYRKGAWVLHMLRTVLGDQAFFEAVRAYRATYQGAAATTAQFRDSVEQATGRDLDRFFDQWVFGTGAPAFAYGSQAFTVNGKAYARVHIRQTQPAGFGVNGLFHVPINLRVDSAQGSVTRTVYADAATDYFVVRAIGSAGVTGVALDEFDLVLATDKVPEAYTPGPPVVVETSPNPGEAFAAEAPPSSVSIYFSEPVGVNTSHVTLTGPAGVVARSFAYDAGLRRVRLTPLAPLLPGLYTVMVSASVVSTAGGRGLDGEVVGNVLPSGDGGVGGAAVITFTVASPVVPPCLADFDGSGTVDPDDLSDYIACYFAAPPCVGADFSGDGNVDPDDLSDFIAIYFTGC